MAQALALALVVLLTLVGRSLPALMEVAAALPQPAPLTDLKRSELLASENLRKALLDVLEIGTEVPGYLQGFCGDEHCNRAGRKRN